MNPKNEQFLVLNYRIYNPDSDKKTKIHHVKEMKFNVINQKNLPFKTVLIDSCYATQRLIALIDNMRKIYYCSEKLIQSIDDTCGAEKFATLSWNESERKSGKIIKIKGIILR